MFFNKNLNYLTSHSGKKIGTIAEDLSIGYETYRKYLDASQPRFEVVIAIANYFHISLDDLLTRDIEKESFLETNKNEVVNEAAASVYFKDRPRPNLNHIIADLVKDEVKPMQLQLKELQEYVNNFVLLLKVEEKLCGLKKEDATLIKKP